MSLFLAVVIEVLPTEADLMWGLRNSILWLCLAKAVCLAAILTPLLVYVVLTGREGIGRAKGKILIIGIIVFVKIAIDIG